MEGSGESKRERERDRFRNITPRLYMPFWISSQNPDFATSYFTPSFLADKDHNIFCFLDHHCVRV